MKKENAHKKNSRLLKVKCMAGLLSVLVLSSCKKENTAAPVTVHNYEGQWKNAVPVPVTGPLDYFSLTSELVAGGTGTLTAVYLENNHAYAKTVISWQKIAGDSIVITLNIPAYPDETWELRGLTNKSNTAITANYYSTPNNNPAGKHKYGSFVLNRL